jgi:sirohydrochlorin ferrochelatase
MGMVNGQDRLSDNITALLLMAHGSRRPKANADLDYLVDQLRQQGRYPIVQASFLELAEPDIEQGAAQCVAQGATRVLMLPYFLSAGKHVQQDLTEICQRLANRFPHVDFHLGEPLGRHPLLLDIVIQRAQEMEG